MMKNYISFAALGVLLCLTACNGGDNKKNEKGDEKPMVRVETVFSRDVEQIQQYTATVEPNLINNISPAQPGRIKQILVDEGMRVSKGQRLVIMDDINTDIYRNQVETARANFANAQRDYNRALELYKIGGGTRQSVDQLETQLTSARNNLSQAERNLRNANENTVLISPINGVITARNYDPGDVTGQMPILTVAQVQPVKIVINVTENDLPRLHKGMPATVTFDTFGEETFNGKVTLIAPTIDTQTRTFGVEVTLPNSDNRILPGMFGRVKLNLGHANHVVVPDKAVVKQQGSARHFVYIYNNGRVIYREVELGQRLGDAYEILSGVEPGDKVVVAGQAKLANDREVELAK